MRNPARIDVFCAHLAKLWKSNCPDWRFGQLVTNLMRTKDIFYLEEDEMLDYIEEYFKENM